MKVVTADPKMTDALGSLRERAEIRSASGDILGYYTPRALEEERLYELADREFDAADIESSVATHPDGQSIEQVLQHLNSLGTP